MAEHNDLGKWGEELAQRYLIEKGYAIRDVDWRLGKRDLDIIAISEDQRTLVFVEVKSRKWDDVMDPTEAVDVKKMKSIGFCANAYIKEYNLDMDFRFDVITIVGNNNTEIKISHIEDAFNPCLL